jgi:hypothetical protein
VRSMEGSSLSTKFLSGLLTSASFALPTMLRFQILPLPLSYIIGRLIYYRPARSLAANTNKTIIRMKQEWVVGVF